MLARLVQHNVRLAKAGTPLERIRELAALAEVLDRKTRDLAEEADSGDLEELAKLYEKVVKEGVVPHANALTQLQRHEALDPIVKQLEKTEADAKKRASAMSESAAQPLLLIASAAGAGRHSLGQLVREVTP